MSSENFEKFRHKSRKANDDWSGKGFYKKPKHHPKSEKPHTRRRGFEWQMGEQDDRTV